MDHLVFASRTGALLELSRVANPYPDDPSRMPAWAVRLSAPSLEATVVVLEAGWEPRTLADFLADLARDSGGWDGDRVWRSAEAELTLTASHPLRNTVTLLVELEGDPPTWSARAELELDPGVFAQLGEVARQLGNYPIG